MSQRILIPASIAFAVLWTLAMVWTLRPAGPVATSILAYCGGIAGLGWYGGMYLFGRWWFGRREE
jgi:hypothetical protein